MRQAPARYACISFRRVRSRKKRGTVLRRKDDVEIDFSKPLYPGLRSACPGLRDTTPSGFRRVDVRRGSRGRSCSYPSCRRVADVGCSLAKPASAPSGARRAACDSPGREPWVGIGARHATQGSRPGLPHTALRAPDDGRIRSPEPVGRHLLASGVSPWFGFSPCVFRQLQHDHGVDLVARLAGVGNGNP